MLMVKVTNVAWMDWFTVFLGEVLHFINPTTPTCAMS